MIEFEFISKNLALNEEKIFKIPQKSGHLVLLKKTGKAIMILKSFTITKI